MSEVNKLPNSIRIGVKAELVEQDKELINHEPMVVFIEENKCL